MLIVSPSPSTTVTNTEHEDGKQEDKEVSEPSVSDESNLKQRDQRERSQVSTVLARSTYMSDDTSIVNFISINRWTSRPSAGARELHLTITTISKEALVNKDDVETSQNRLTEF